MNVQVMVDGDSLTKIGDACRAAGRDLRKEFRIAVTKASKRTELYISKFLRKRLNVQKQDLKSSITAKRSKGKEDPSAVVVVNHEKRLPLKRFGARQVRKGVSYKIDKTRSREVGLGMFGPNIGRLGQHAFIRENYTSPAGARRKKKAKKRNRVLQFRPTRQQMAKPKKPLSRAKKKRTDNLPIVKRYGLSAWGMFVKNAMTTDTAYKGREFLGKELERRANFVMLKHLGKI